MQAHLGAYFEKFACTLVSALIVTVQLAFVPLHAPLQPRKLWPAGGVAVTVTSVPAAYLAEQLLPQSMPAGELLMVPGLLRPADKVKLEPPPPPPPPPTTTTVLNVAVTVLSAFTVTVQVGALPAHAPPHASRLAPAAGLAVKATVLPGA